ncbi:fimbrial major subunit CsuA/B family protein [Salmonella enterica subsp. houtenae serovar 43:z4,z23:-]|nr:fimbrial major subunit CsuA/B family protein [Salmonella enterica]EHF3222022.1 fimbrial major subunit CsuA/B family protein [Salmonella enterica subsp. houtenae serovar Houten]
MYNITGQLTDIHGLKQGAQLHATTLSASLGWSEVGVEGAVFGGVFVNDSLILITNEPNGTINTATIEMSFLISQVQEQYYMPSQGVFKHSINYIVHDGKPYPLDYPYNPCAVNTTNMQLNHGSISPGQTNGNTTTGTITVNCTTTTTAKINITGSTPNASNYKISMSPNGETALSLNSNLDKTWGTNLENSLPVGITTYTLRSILNKNNEPGAKSGQSVITITFN